MNLIVDADSIIREAQRLLGSHKAATLCLLRLTYKVKMLTHPEHMTVFSTESSLPFINVEHDALLARLQASPTKINELIILSCDPEVLALQFFSASAYRPNSFFLEPEAVSHTRLRKELGYDPLDIGWFAERGITEPVKTDKAKAGRDRKSRWAWTTNERAGQPLETVVDNIAITVGRDGFKNFTVVQDVPDLLRLLDHADGVAGWDTETTGLDWRKDYIVGESFSIDGQHGYYLPIAHNALGTYQNIPYGMVVDMVHPRLAKMRLRGVNLPFDVLMTSGANGKPGVPFFTNLEDAQGYAYMLGYHVPNPKMLGLKLLTRTVLGEHMEEYEAVASGKASFADIPIDRAAPYAADDAVKSYQLAEILRARLTDEQRQRYDEVEMPFLNVATRMQYNGLYLDMQRLQPLLEEFDAEMEALKYEMWAHAGHEFNIKSGLQLQKVLFEELGITPTKRTKTGWSTRADDLERIQAEHHIIVDDLRHKELAKLVDTYLSGYPQYVNTDGRIHSALDPFSIITGRLASRSPNLTNIPVRTETGARIRSLFCAQYDNMLGSIDASQLEYRLLAHATQNATLLTAFNDATRDPHKEMASLIFEIPVNEVLKHHRDAAKTTVYAILYGAWIDKIATTLGISRREAQRIYDAIYRVLPELVPLRNKIIEEARQNGYVTSMLGHRSYIDGLDSRVSSIKQGAERSAFDSYFQGTASGDITKIVCIRAQAMLDEMFPNVLAPEVMLVLQIHDELLVEGRGEFLDEVCGRIATMFSEVIDLSVPIESKYQIGKTWADIH